MNSLTSKAVRGVPKNRSSFRKRFHCKFAFAALFSLVLALTLHFTAQAFEHPGGLHTFADLERMKTNVLAGNHPWIDGWNALIADPQAQSTYTPAPLANMGANRQRADADAHAAYLNALRWYISGNTAYANAATNILNKWATTVNQVPTDTGLIGIPIMSFALSGELLRTYSGWQASDFASFTNMMLTYMYPACTNWVWNQPCNYAHWTSWDARNNAAILTIGVLCDNTNLFNEAVNRYKGTVSTAAISNAIPNLFGSLGQPMEAGRDQEHCILGIADMGVTCQVAWNQGVDLYGYANNRLLAGIEYLAQYNLAHDVPYTSFNNCANENLFFISNNGRGRLDDRPVYEMFYNHYVVRQGLSAPGIAATARLYRPERGSADHFGYGTLTFTLNAAASPYPPNPLPPSPTGLVATPGVAQVTLNWTSPANDSASGYKVLRATTSGGPYTTIASWTANTSPTYTDTNVVNGTTYYYVVSAVNQNGASAPSAEISATASTVALPAGWTQQDVGVVTSTGTATYTATGNNTFYVTGAGTGIGGTGDGGFNYTYRLVTNNFTMIARLTSFSADEVGLMMRGSLASNSAAVQFFMANGARQSVFAFRNGNGANLNHYNTGDQFTSPPTWYKLVRSGNDFTAYQSDDGINWITVQTATVSSIPASGYYVGLAINIGSATFDNVVYTNAAVTGAFSPPAAPLNVAAAAPASSVVALTWNAVTNASGYSVKRGIISGGPYASILTDMPPIGAYDNTVVANTTYYYVVTANNGGGESANSVEVSVTTPAAAAPATPAGLVASPTDTQIGLNWSAAAGATSYNVKRGPNGGPYTNIATGVISTFTDANVTTGVRYFYVVSAVNSAGESANSSQASGMLPGKLTGTIIGTSGSWGNLGNTRSNAFDGSLTTYFDGPDASGDWAGLDFGAGISNVVGLIKYCPRATWSSRMVGGVFQGANDANFTSPTTLFTIATAPADGALTPQTIAVNSAFRYVRYLSPNNGYCNVAELEFWGAAPLPPTPAAPTSLSAIPGNTQVTLDWNAVSGATGYSVKRATVSGGPYTTLSSVSTTSFTDTSLNNGTTYYYVVTTLNDVGESAYSPQANATPQVSAPSAPTGLVATAGNAQVTLSWNAASGATSYNVKRSITSGSGNVTVTNATGTSVVDTGLVNGTTYYYVISALNGGGESANSSQVSATPHVPTPSAPTGLAATSGNTQATLTWTASSGAMSYNVKRSTTSGSGYVTVSNATGTSVVDVGLNNGTTYYYVVSALNAGGESANSSQVSVTPTDLFAWWKFNETSSTTAADSGGNGFNGTLQSGATWIAGVSSNAVRLDGTANGYVSFPAGIVGTLNDFSVATFVKVETNATWARVFDFGSGTGSYMFLTPASGGNTVRYAITTSGNGSEQQINSASVLSTGVWHHVAVTLSGSTGVLYIDGKAVGTNSSMTLKPSSLGSTTQNYLGKSQYADPNLTGSMDDFRIYGRALSAVEVATLASGTLPSPWAQTDVGVVGLTGQADYVNGTFTIQGAGTDLAGTADSLRFVYQPATGDCTNTLRVVSLPNTGANAKAGVMIRESLNANAREAGVWVTPSSGLIFTRRTSTGGTTTTSISSGKVAPYWVRLTRTGNIFRAYYSANGTTWTQFGGDRTISMGSSTYIGMGVESSSTSTLNTATMGNTTVIP